MQSYINGDISPREFFSSVSFFICLSHKNDSRYHLSRLTVWCHLSAQHQDHCYFYICLWLKKSILQLNMCSESFISESFYCSQWNNRLYVNELIRNRPWWQVISCNGSSKCGCLLLDLRGPIFVSETGPTGGSSDILVGLCDPGRK